MTSKNNQSGAPDDPSTENDKAEVLVADDDVADEDPILLRLIYAIFFYFVYALSRFVLGIVAVVQLLHILLTEEYQQDLLCFSRSMTRFISQLVAYLTWVSNRKPFPFADWPSDGNQRNGREG